MDKPWSVLLSSLLFLLLLIHYCWHLSSNYMCPFQQCKRSSMAQTMKNFTGNFLNLVINGSNGYLTTELNMLLPRDKGTWLPKIVTGTLAECYKSVEFSCIILLRVVPWKLVCQKVQLSEYFTANRTIFSTKARTTQTEPPPSVGISQTLVRKDHPSCESQWWKLKTPKIETSKHTEIDFLHRFSCSYEVKFSYVKHLFHFLLWNHLANPLRYINQ